MCCPRALFLSPPRCSEEGPKHKFLPLKDVLQPSPKLEADSVASAFGYYAETAEGGEGVNVKDVARRLCAGVASSGLPRFLVLVGSGWKIPTDIQLFTVISEFQFVPSGRWCAIRCRVQMRDVLNTCE